MRTTNQKNEGKEIHFSLEQETDKGLYEYCKPYFIIQSTPFMKLESLSPRMRRMLTTAARRNSRDDDGPRGFDTFVALPPATPAGVCIFGKNSDRPVGEGQSITRYPAADYDGQQQLQCTYVSIPQVAHTHAVLLSQIGEFVVHVFIK